MAATLSVYIDADDVEARLVAMGLTDEPLAHAARRWYLSWVSFTANHPPFAIGIAAWMEAVAALREGLLPLGWTRSDEKNYALVIHPDAVMAINIASGDAGTGIPTANVSNRAPKGVSTADNRKADSGCERLANDALASFARAAHPGHVILVFCVAVSDANIAHQREILLRSNGVFRIKAHGHKALVDGSFG